MKQSAYGKARDALIAANTGPDRRPCLRCKAATPLATLSDFGGRCFECYLAFCNEPQDTAAPAPTLFAREAHEATRRLMALRIASEAPLPPGVRP